jgi:hypothetical protein
VLSDSSHALRPIYTRLAAACGSRSGWAHALAQCTDGAGPDYRPRSVHVVSNEDAARTLEQEPVRKFQASWADLLGAAGDALDKLAAQGAPRREVLPGRGAAAQAARVGRRPGRAATKLEIANRG